MFGIIDVDAPVGASLVDNSTRKGQAVNTSLPPRVAFWSGMARVLDIGATIQRNQVLRARKPVRDIDAEVVQALAGDWEKIGGDMLRAIEKARPDNHGE